MSCVLRYVRLVLGTKVASVLEMFGLEFFCKCFQDMAPTITRRSVLHVAGLPRFVCRSITII